MCVFIVIQQLYWEYKPDSFFHEKRTLAEFRGVTSNFGSQKLRQVHISYKSVKSNTVKLKRIIIVSTVPY